MNLGGYVRCHARIRLTTNFVGCQAPIGTILIKWATLPLDRLIPSSPAMRVQLLLAARLIGFQPPTPELACAFINSIGCELVENG